MTDSRPLLRLGHSPDPDDAFMWWPLFSLEGNPPALNTGRFRFEPVQQDIESLNQRSASADLEITALSAAQYPHVRHQYAITSCGASLGNAYGPRLVTPNPELTLDSLKNRDVVIAVPGLRTTAFTTLSLVLGRNAYRYETVPFDQIIPRLIDGSYPAGLIIHEGQLTFAEAGLHLLLDLGDWWKRETGLLLPLGVNAVRRDLEDLHGPGTLAEIASLLHSSVQYALENRDDSIAYARNFARDLEPELVDRFVEMYVNKWTLDFGAEGIRGLRVFLDTAHQAGLIPDPGPVDLVFPRPGQPVPEDGGVMNNSRFGDEGSGYLIIRDAQGRVTNAESRRDLEIAKTTGRGRGS